MTQLWYCWNCTPPAGWKRSAATRQVADQEGDRPEPERAPDAAVEREQADDERGRERHHPQERGSPAVHPGAAHATPLPTNHTAIAAIPTANARA